MSSKLSSATVLFGDTGPQFQTTRPPAQHFEKSGQPGDTNQWDIPLQNFPPNASIRGIVTPSSRYAGAPHTHIVGSLTFFFDKSSSLWVMNIRARNSGSGSGDASMMWLAIAETGLTQSMLPAIRMGVGQPRSFAPDSVTGDTVTWAVSLPQPSFRESPFVLLTANHIGTVGDPAHNAAAVGLIDDLAPKQPPPSGPAPQPAFAIRARNSDCAAGDCGFNYVALAELPGPGGPGPVAQDLIVDSGATDQFGFAHVCTPGDTITTEVVFAAPYDAPPVVLATAIRANGAMPVCMARNVTRFGFTLAARNSDTNQLPSPPDGYSGFNWVAFGCGGGCG